MGYSLLDYPHTDIVLPDVAEIKSLLEKAKADALTSAENLGIILQHPSTAATDSLVPSMHWKNMDKSEQKVGDNTIMDLEKGVSQEESQEDEEVRNDISLFNSFTELELKDYTKTKTMVTSGSPYVEVLLNNNNKKIVRKSAICWFFGNKCGRLSTDRIQRVRGMTNKSTKRPQTAKHKKTKKTKPSRGDVSIDESTDTDNADVFSVHSDNFSEDFSDSGTDEEENKDKGPIIKPEEYYAVYYDLQWYIGRVIKSDATRSLIKFLTFDLDHYSWPKTPDISEVENKYIFYGPFQLTGSCPFYLKRADEFKINKKYKDLKKQQNIY